MKFNRIILSLTLLIQVDLSFSQEKKVSNPLQEQEIALLNIITADSVNSLNLKLNSSLFNFGLDTKTFKHIALIKKGKNTWVQPSGTGKLFKIEKNKSSYALIRIDSTLHSGVNYQSFTFILHDTIFQYGGSGFWNMRGIMTYFSPQTHEWELYPSNAIVNGYDDFDNIIKYKVDASTNKLFASKSLAFSNMPRDFSLNSIDSCFEFDFTKNTWSTLGATNPALIKTIETATYYNYNINEILVFQNYLDYYWIDFSKNEYGKVKSYSNQRMKQAWLSLYNTKETYDGLQFNLGNTVYLVKILSGNKLSYATYTINADDLDRSTIQYVYKVENPLLHFFFNKALPFFTPSVSIVMLISFGLFFIVYRQRKKRVPKEVTARLNYNFYHSLSIIEKELLQVLYKNHQKGESISTKVINKIIGVQNKDVLTQNKSRSDHFLKINQKYKLSTQQQLPLIVKTRDSIDKRQYNYGLEPSYLVYLEKMIESEKSLFDE
jgi:hypothetical protein